MAMQFILYFAHISISQPVKFPNFVARIIIIIDLIVKIVIIFLIWIIISLVNVIIIICVVQDGVVNPSEVVRNHLTESDHLD